MDIWTPQLVHWIIMSWSWTLPEVNAQERASQVFKPSHASPIISTTQKNMTRTISYRPQYSHHKPLLLKVSWVQLQPRPIVLNHQYFSNEQEKRNQRSWDALLEFQQLELSFSPTSTENLRFSHLPSSKMLQRLFITQKTVEMIVLKVRQP